jgi:hypothetical protein
VSAFFAVILTAQTAHKTLWQGTAETAIEKALPGGIGGLAAQPGAGAGD